MTVGIWVLGDQLWQGQSALVSREGDRPSTPVILIESQRHVMQRPYHKQKLVLVWSAMRHFAEELKAAGWSVTYAIAPDFITPLTQWIASHQITELRVMEPSDRPFAEFLDSLVLDSLELGGLEWECTVVRSPSNHFLWSTAAFEQWAGDRKRLLMESFYREGRKRYGILMDGNEPVGGQWNFDKENRKPPKGAIHPPQPLWFEPDAITQAVIDVVAAADWSTFGDVDHFGWAVTRHQALQVLDHFIALRLPTFGPYQDAMVTDEDTLWHALLSPYLNLGLLQPMEVIQAVETAYQAQNLPLNSVEGFIRQVLGWREYMRGLYNYVGADYPNRNFFDHYQPLPDWFWTGKTEMNCLSQTLGQIRRTGYGHHIQRLMLLSNFALIAGLSPQAVEQWFHAVFIDAYDWVMQTNVIGMGLFADGGVLATKPYAASANYINRMSDYCKGCRYNPKQRTGEDACPFNFFYWDFLMRHRDTLKSQGRMNFILKNIDKMSEPERVAIHQAVVDWYDQNLSHDA